MYYVYTLCAVYHDLFFSQINIFPMFVLPHTLLTMFGKNIVFVIGIP